MELGSASTSTNVNTINNLMLRFTTDYGTDLTSPPDLFILTLTLLPQKSPRPRIPARRVFVSSWREEAALGPALGPAEAAQACIQAAQGCN